MREGLRSGKLNGKDGVNSEKGCEENGLGADSRGEKVKNLVSGGCETERESPGLRIEDELDNEGFEGGGGGDEGRSGKVGVADSARKRKRVDGDEEIDNGDIGEKKVKEEVERVNDKQPICRRVLRSSTVLNGGCSKMGSEDVLEQKISGDGGCEKKWVEERKEKCDELVNKLGGNLKRKRGRPPMAKKVESDASGWKALNGKRGRPCKVEKEEHGSLPLYGGLRKRLKGKRGRPRKVQQGSGALKLKRGRPLKVQESSGAMKPKRGRPPKVIDRNGGLPFKLGRLCKVEKQEHNSSESDDRLNKRLKLEHGRPMKVPEINEFLKGDDDKEGQVSIDDKEHDSLESNGQSKKKLKCKLGRPPKVQESNGDLKGDVDKEGQVSKENKRGFESWSRIKQSMSACLQESNEILKGDVDKEGQESMEDRRGLELQDRIRKNVPAYFSYHEKALIRKQLNMRRFSPKKKIKDGAESETKENDGASGKRSKAVIAVSLENQKGVRKGKIIEKSGDVEPGRSMIKQSVRDKIVEILLSAGWTIERRPRAGRNYFDAVYVEPGGNTHWSITKAYKMLKKHYEDGNGESQVYKIGFKFIPIPDEELNMLKRVILKKRLGKKKLKPAKGDCGNANLNEVLSKKKHKKKLVGKSQRGRPRGKSLLLEHNRSACKEDKGMPLLVLDPNQLNRRNGKRFTLLVRNSLEEADSGADGYIPYSGKRTVLAWMIDLGTVSVNEKVHYVNQTKKRVLREGRITRDGILCDCCSETLTSSEFEIHTGSKLCEPFKNICLESGTSLLQCLLESWNKQQESERMGFLYLDVHGEDPNDDACGICGDGGDLICCDSCPSTFHQSCLDIQKFPSGDWHCVYCSCKFCWMEGQNECPEDDNDNLVASELLTCQFCEEKYHRSCSKAKDAESVYSNSSFCGKKCEKLFEKLKILFGVKHHLEEGFSWTLVRRADIDSSISLCDIPQRCDVSREIECNSKLAVALSVMDECFLPLVDHRSGINLIHNVVYNCGSNFNRLNYSGFFTAILERGDDMVCVASIRIHGNQFAEMPFIGTRYMYRRQGMCRRLLSVIESVLRSLDVERLVIPAISELKETWTSVFGFRPLEASSKQKMKNVNMMVFPHIQMLQKPMLKLQTDEENMILVVGPESTELEEHQTKKEVLCKISPHGIGMKEPVFESSLQLPDGSLNNTDGKCLVESGEAYDNLEDENKTIADPSGSIRVLCEQTEDTTEYQKASSGLTPAVDQWIVELSSQSNQRSISEKDSESFVLPCSESDANACETSVHCASREGNESADCEAKVENHIVTDILNSCNEGSRHLSTEFDTAEPCEEVFSLEFEASNRNAICLDSKTSSQISTGDMDLKCSHSEHCKDEKTFEIYKMQHNHSAVVQAPAILGEIHSTSTESSVSQNPHASKVSVELVHKISTQTAEDDFKDSQQGDELKTHEVLVFASVNTNSDPSSLAFIDSNGLCKSKEVICASPGVVVDSVRD